MVSQVVSVTARVTGVSEVHRAGAVTRRLRTTLQISGQPKVASFRPSTQVVLIGQPILAGLVKVRPQWLNVTRGIGFRGPLVRIGSPPEVALRTLRSRPTLHNRTASSP
jgi:hypothetical protein